MTAGVEAHAEQALVAELVAQALPVLGAEVVDPFDLGLLQPRALDAVGQDRPERHQVGVDARVRLHVGVLGAEELARVLGRDGLDGVDVLAGGVEAVTDRALGVLVGEPGPHRHQHRGRGVVLAGDELERGSLVGELGDGGRGDARLDGADHLERLAVDGGGETVLVGLRGRVHGHGRSLIASRPGAHRARPPRATRPRGVPSVSLFRRTSQTVIRRLVSGVSAPDNRSMIGSGTSVFLVVRRHVDLGRTRSMICRPC